MMISYSLFGTIPLLPYAIAEGVDSASRVGVFIASVVMALFSLALLGLLQVGVGEQRGRGGRSCGVSIASVVLGLSKKHPACLPASPLTGLHDRAEPSEECVFNVLKRWYRMRRCGRCASRPFALSPLCHMPSVHLLPLCSYPASWLGSFSGHRRLIQVLSEEGDVTLLTDSTSRRANGFKGQRQCPQQCSMCRM